MRLLPFEYAVRNLGRSTLRLVLSVLGSFLVVMLVIAAVAFVRGMEKSLIGSGSPDNVILLGAGSAESVERSELSPSVAGLVSASVPGIKTKLGLHYVSPEVHMSLVISARAGEDSTRSAVIRGITPTAYLVHKQLRIVQGRAPLPGHDEVMVGQLAATRIGWQPEALEVGKTLWFDNRPWTIVGAFSASGTVMDAEIWCPLTDLQIAAKRDSLSCVILTLDGADFSDVDIFASTRLDLEIIAIREDQYYRQLVSFYRPIRLMVWVTASLIAMGGLFGGLNTLYAAFAARFREMGMLQSLGYSRAAVALSLMQESVLISLTGALLASTVALILLEGVAVKISMGAFGLVLDAPTLAIGLAAGLILGVVGAIPPTLNCLRQPITEALKSA
ncbi:MAG: ABC transporter permease [Planctomycetes bacterium]|nr:ABC transporter permease [Planctomycetota bacterium]